MRQHLLSTCGLLALTITTLSLTPNLNTGTLEVADATAQSRYIAEFEQKFERRKSIIERDLKRGKLSPVDTKRMTETLDRVLRSMKRDGVDTDPYQKRMDDYLAALPGRLTTIKRDLYRDSVSKKIPRVAPEPGVVAIKAEAPTWCNDIVEKKQKARFRTAAKRLQLPSYATSLSLNDLDTVAYFACFDPDNKVVQKWVQAYRQRLSNLIGLNQEQSDKLFDYVTKSYQSNLDRGRSLRKRGGIKHCAKIPDLKDGLIERRVSRKLERNALSCNGGGSMTPSFSNTNLRFPTFPYWYIDTAEGPTTQLARVGLIGSLLVSRGGMLNLMASPSQPKYPDLMMQNFAIANTVDVDLAKLSAELDGMGLDEEQTWMMRFRAWGILRARTRVGDFTKAFVASNPGYEKVFYSGPKAAVETSMAAAATNKSLLEKLVAIEERIDPRKAGGLNGCAKALFSELEPWVKKTVKANKKQNYQDFSFEGYRGSLLLHGLMFCGMNDNSAAGLSYLLLEKHQRTTIEHGPLSAAYMGMVAAFSELQTGEAKTDTFSTRRRGSGPTVKVTKLSWNPVQPPALPRDLHTGMNLRKSKGVIEKVKKKGDVVVVSFKSVKYKQAIRKCRNTNRISYIGSNGIVYYRQKCKTVGSKMVTEKNDPIEIPAWAAKGLKRGQFMVYMGGSARYASQKNKGTLRRGWPYAVFKGKKQKRLLNLYGVKL